MATSFVPAECAALAIQACIRAKRVKLAQFDFAGLSETLDAGLGLVNVAKVEVDLLNACTVDAINRAFAEAGCTAPTYPPVADPPDVSDCTAAQASLSQQVNGDVLLFLGSSMVVTLDGNDLPTLITVP